jgi:O-antigen/teichoic acid export membrane protein
VEWVYAVIALGILLSVAISASWLATHWLHAEKLSTDTVAQALMISGPAIAARWLCGLYREALSGLQRQVWLNGCTALFATVRGAGAVGVLAWISPSIQAFFAFQALLLGLEALTLAREMRRILPVAPRSARFDRQALHAVRHFAGGMAAITVLAILLTQVDKLLLSRLLPLSEFGYYALAGTVAGALSVVIEPIRNATYPRLTQLVVLGDRSALAEAYHSYSQLLTLMIVPASLVLSLFSGHVLLLWTRDWTTTQTVAPLASLLVIGSMLNGLMHTPYTLQLAHGWTRLTVVTNVIAVLILVPAIYLAVSAKGAPGAAMIWIILNAGYIALAVPAMHRRLLPGEMRRWYWQDVGIPTTATCAVVALARLALPEPALENPMQSVAAVLAVAVAAQLVGTLATPAGRNWLADQIRTCNPRPRGRGNE